MTKLLALDIGSGHKPVERTGWYKPGDMPYEFVNMDLYHEEANCRWDFNKLPWPFPDNHFDSIFARHVLEHVRRENFVGVMKEIYRVSRDGALFYIRVPYWNSESFAGDPTHWNPFCETTFRHFCYGGSLDTEFYIPPMFEILSINYRFHPKLRLIPKKVLKELYHILSGVCDELWVVLRVVKTNPVEGIISYNPERTYSFNVPVDWKTTFIYGSLFWGALVLGLLALLDIVGVL
jgi:SAM-dependent methyltransferase